MTKIDLSPFDFVDFGCSAGRSILFAQQRLGGRRGLGLDIDPRKVEAARSCGVDAMVADVTELAAAAMGSVRFVVMSHFLEHLPGMQLARKCVETACAIADEYVFIRQPYFDADGYLFESGLKLYWSDWTGHLNHMTSLQLYNALSSAGLGLGRAVRVIIFRQYIIRNSLDGAVHPLSSSPDSHEWSAVEHERKEFYEFSIPVYRELGGIVLMGSTIPSRLNVILKHCDVVFDSG